MKKNDIEECSIALSKNLNLPEDSLKASDYDALVLHVTRVVSDLMDQNFEKLLMILYRIDIEESKIKQILSLQQPGLIARTIAETIIKREFEKIESRRKYSQ